MISYGEALSCIADETPLARTEQRPLTACTGRVLAEDLTVRVPSPAFTQSAMDGYAVRWEEARSGPLRVMGVRYAGKAVKDISEPKERTCVKIMTGAPVPPWADTVVPVERARGTDAQDGGTVAFDEIPDKGSFVRPGGADLEEGAPLLRRGTPLDPERILAAASTGHAKLPIFRPPAVVLYSTGEELAEPGEDLAYGVLYNSTKYFLSSAVEGAGLTVKDKATLGDDGGLLSERIESALSADEAALILTTGAVSAGDRDFVPETARRMGFETVFHKVAIKPGKPVFLARRGEQLWLGLPGNPVSTCIGWHAFAREILHRWGATPPARRRTVKLATDVTKPQPLRCFFRASLDGDQATVLPQQESAYLGATLSADAYVELPEGERQLPATTKVEALVL